VIDEEHRVPEEGLGRDLTLEALRRKLDALGSDSFPFLRGTFHVMATDLLQARVPGTGASAHIPSWDLDKAEAWLQQLLREKGRRTEMDLVAKAAPGRGHRRFGEDGDPRRFAHTPQP
jgi:hypothetical protein